MNDLCEKSRRHVRFLTAGLNALDAELPKIEGWGRSFARALRRGGRLLVAGNGGSAAQAQHLTSELVGRYLDERNPLSAIALHAETSSLTAISNDYGADEAFARQVRAHGRNGDIFVGLSTSGRSVNVRAAAVAAREVGARTFALTGSPPNPLALECDSAICVETVETATVQEVHLVIVHLLCEAIDAAVTDADQGQLFSTMEIA
jgi:D-sedoheptulose 7-phosphate isomerase